MKKLVLKTNFPNQTLILVNYVFAELLSPTSEYGNLKF